MSEPWPYNLPPWRRKVEAVSPDGEITATIEHAAELFMSGPTAGDLVLTTGIRVPMCSPCPVWSSDSLLLAIPQWRYRFGFLERERILLIDPRARTICQISGWYELVILESLDQDKLKLTISPLSGARAVELDLSTCAKAPVAV